MHISWTESQNECSLKGSWLLIPKSGADACSAKTLKFMNVVKTI